MNPSQPVRATPLRPMHPVIVRITHWINAVAIIVMILSGWKIYNDEVIFGFLHFPQAIVLGVHAQHALQWHFFAMWILVLNGIVYLVYGIVSGRFRRMLLPIRPADLWRELVAALSFRLDHADVTMYNAVQKLLYVGVIAAVIVQVISGLAIWKPVQFASLVSLFVDFQGARLAHFMGMAVIVAFLLVHVALALLVPRTIVAMIGGGPLVDPAAAAHPPAAHPPTARS